MDIQQQVIARTEINTPQRQSQTTRPEYFSTKFIPNKDIYKQILEANQ